jgi:hypothetical protein
MRFVATFRNAFLNPRPHVNLNPALPGIPAGSARASSTLPTREMVNHRTRPSLAPALSSGLLALLLAALVAGPAAAQTTASRAAAPTAEDSAKNPGPKPRSTFGTALSRAEARALLGEMQQLTRTALAKSRASERAKSVAEVKAAADEVLRTVWGSATARGAGEVDEVRQPGWKERWQVNGGEWAASYSKRLGTAPPTITDPRQLGVMGRGRAVRGRLMKLEGAAAIAADTAPVARLLASVNNVIGWTYMSDGLKGNENQPRVSLTYLWDAPPEFWQSSADTGWLDEVFAQAVNILKTDYGSDVAEARRHAAGMSELLEKVLNGVDADRNGTVDPKMMEGGLNAALRVAGTEGL